ncbi:forkhead box protein I1-B [Phlebotomus argentipes]|uniref:forkhead box protein I1-B n=1 Tax=Phlebotomus argentipes TaxID=94469 RepID=UPI0028937C7F|nr:forkhead box protein I1-B [Phlebotomus argentipes]
MAKDETRGAESESPDSRAGRKRPTGASLAGQPAEDGGQFDDDENELTNLNWLTELKNGYMQLADGPVLDIPMTRFNKFLDELRSDRDKYRQDEEYYKMNAQTKPPFNYAHLIGISLMENGRMTLQQVYDWIQSSFAYYRLCNTNWQSSIRHNLSLGYFFKNTARGGNERGKGGYWELALDSRKSYKKRHKKAKKAENENANGQPPGGRTFLRRVKMKSQPKTRVQAAKAAAPGNSAAGQEPKIAKDTPSLVSVCPEDVSLNSKIFAENEVPQPVDDVEIPYFINTSSPNVIVEPLPYNLPPLDDYNFTTSFNEQRIFEDLLEYENELL